MSAFLVFILFAAAWVVAILGGMGVGGMGRDSRALDPRAHSDDRPWRSLLSR